MTDDSSPQTSPEACLEVAYKHQDMYEETVKRYGAGSASGLLEHHHRMVVANAALATASFLAQTAICGHGTRGWCPFCAGEIESNGFLS